MKNYFDMCSDQKQNIKLEIKSFEGLIKVI
jgi:hypothetical protein